MIAEKNTRPQRKDGTAPRQKTFEKRHALTTCSIPELLLQSQTSQRPGHSEKKRRKGRAEPEKSDKNKELCEGGFPARRGAQLPAEPTYRLTEPVGEAELTRGRLAPKE